MRICSQYSYVLWKDLKYIQSRSLCYGIMVAHHFKNLFKTEVNSYCFKINTLAVFPPVCVTGSFRTKLLVSLCRESSEIGGLQTCALFNKPRTRTFLQLSPSLSLCLSHSFFITPGRRCSKCVGLSKPKAYQSQATITSNTKQRDEIDTECNF